MFYLLLVTYILGGLTLVPLLALSVLAYLYCTSTPLDPPTPNPRPPTPPPDTDPSTRPPSLKSWLTARRTFAPSPSTYISLVRTLLDARSTRPRRAPDAFFAVLKHKVLYLYDDDALSECTAAISLPHARISIAPPTPTPPDSPTPTDGELFAKRNAVLIHDPASDAPWFLFFRAVNEMEDWYLALLAESALHATPAPYPYTAHKLLIDSLDALPDRIPTRWLNALLGRLFLGVKGTRAVEAWVVGRLMKKLSKVKTPGWLSAVVVRSFDAGDVAPVLSKPMLKELTPEGEASVGVDISYVAPPSGGIRITLSATATITLPPTPSLSMLGFKKDTDDKDKDKDAPKEKPYEVSLVLAVIVRRVQGTMLLKIKRPPSNRLWYAFTTMPQMDIEVLPVVSDRQIRWGMVLSGIEGKLREIIQESVVLPNMDDIPFFDSGPYTLRGGIFADAFAPPSFEHPSEPHDAAAEHKEAPEEEEKHVHRTQSAEVLVDTGADDLPAPGPAPPEPDVEVPRAETISGGGGGGDAGGSVRKRKTWFGGRKSNASEDSTREEGAESGHRRGRSEDAPGVRVLVTRDDTDTPTPTTTDRPPLPARRSVSDSSPLTPTRSLSPSPSPSPPPRTALSTSAPSASTPTTPTPSSSSSFLSTLKSRGAGMAEKQPALKEAMRKWGVGVGWAAGLRKNEGGRDRQGDREREREREREEADAWMGEEGDVSPRGSYADLRRKVELRERERLQDGNGASRPIDIPGARGDEGEGDSSSLQRRGSNTSRSDASSTLSSPRTDPTTTPRLSPPAPAPFLSPSAPRTTTELHTSPRAPSPTPLRPHSESPTSTSTSTPLPPPSPPRPPAPIRAQPPKAATMTIPGIHARHRGEVMGFGSGASLGDNAAPDVQPQAPKAMQSVYKLFRGGAGAGAEGEPRPRTASMPPPLPPRGQATPESPTPRAEVSAASEALKSLAARQPPALPARRTSTSPTHSRRTSQEAEDTPRAEPEWRPPLPPRTNGVKPADVT